MAVYNACMSSVANARSATEAKRVWIISIGTELVLGQAVDTNAATLARALAGLGFRTQRYVTVPDEVAPIREALLEATAACDLVVATGGLGPTDDDVTRQALAEAAGVPLEPDPAIAGQIRAYFAALGREMPERNLRQALVPRAGRAIPNSCGTAPGIFIELGGTPCYVLPGVPFEMEAMFAGDVAPRLAADSSGRVLLSRRLHCFGLGESAVGERIADFMIRGRNPEVGTTAELGVIGVHIRACGATRDDATALLEEAERKIRARLGEVVFGRDEESLASVVGSLLAARSETVSTAESCTGGLIGKLMTDVPGSSRYFLGGAIVYANEAKIRVLGVPREQLETSGAVSEPVARALAVAAQAQFGSTYALAVTGVAGPTGGTPGKPVGLVYIALATPEGVAVRELRYGSGWPRGVIRGRAAWSALDLLRLHLLRRGG